jgi:hypothetical protein
MEIKDMEHNTGGHSVESQRDLDVLVTTVDALVAKYQGDTLLLLALLRTLESLHRQIRDGVFQEALPDNRQHLYKLLRTIETEGGWPYIHRMRLRSLLENLSLESESESESES